MKTNNSIKCELLNLLSQMRYTSAALQQRYRSPQDLILQKGLLFKPTVLDPKYKKAPKGMCFGNTFKLVKKHPDLIYCEGYGLSASGLHHHAWAATTDGVCVDTTWEFNAVNEYLGIPFTTEFIARSLRRRGCYGVIDWWEEDFPLLTGKIDLLTVAHPALCSLAEAQLV